MRQEKGQAAGHLGDKSLIKPKGGEAMESPSLAQLTNIRIFGLEDKVSFTLLVCLAHPVQDSPFRMSTLCLGLRLTRVLVILGCTVSKRMRRCLMFTTGSEGICRFPEYFTLQKNMIS